MKKSPVVMATLLLILMVCPSCRTPVPSNSFKGMIGNAPFHFDFQKQTTATNLVLTSIQGSNTFTLSIGALSGQNDPQVIDKSFAGQALVLKEFFTGANGLIEKAAKGGAEGLTGKK